MNDAKIAADLWDAYEPSDDRQPHRQPAVLRCVLVRHVLGTSDAADLLGNVFEYEVTASAVRSAKNYHDIRDPFFPDLKRRDGDGTEPGQPPKFLCDRPDDTPIHPADTDAYSHLFVTTDTPEGSGREANAESSPTTQSPSPSPSPADTCVPDAPTDTSDSSPRKQTEALKPLSDPTPSDWRIDPSEHPRDASLVAPLYAAEGDHFPDRYKACGCRGCENRHYLDGDSGGAIDCPRPVPVTIAGARRIYEVTEGTAHARDVDGHAVGRGRQQYARLMKADSAALNVRDSDVSRVSSHPTDEVTTVLLSLRLSSTDPQGRLVTPWRLVGDLKDSWAEARDVLPREAGNGRIAAVWMFAGTDHWACPHVHWYGWYYDPDDGVTKGDFLPAVRRFVGAAAFPAEGAHFEDFVDVDPDGSLFGAGSDTDEDVDGGGDVPRGEATDATPAADGSTVADGTHADLTADDLADGVVRAEHDPLLVDDDRFRTRSPLCKGPFPDLSAAATVPGRLKDGSAEQSRGAVYVGSQLPQLALYGAESPAETEAAAVFDTHADGRARFYGQGEFYDLADTTDEMVEREVFV